PGRGRVLGSDQATARRVARLIEPDPLAGEISSGILGEDSARGDLVVVGIGGVLESNARRALSAISVSDVPLVLVQFETSSDVLVLGVAQERIVVIEPTMADEEARELLFTKLVRAAP